MKGKGISVSVAAAKENKLSVKNRGNVGSSPIQQNQKEAEPQKAVQRFLSGFPLACESHGLESAHIYLLTNDGHKKDMGLLSPAMNESDSSVHPDDASLEDQGFQPTTFRIVSKLPTRRIYLKTTDDEESQITDMLIRDWVALSEYLVILQDFQSCLEQVQKISLIKVGMTPNCLQTLVESLKTFSNLKHLILDSTHLGDEGFRMILSSCQMIQHLSLMGCGISDVGAESFSTVLSSQIGWESEGIISLNLSNNMITSVGAKAISKSLRVNRSLLILNLSMNFIDNLGACYLSSVLRQFLLERQEVIDKRRRMVSFCAEQSKKASNPPPTQQPDKTVTTPSSVSSKQASRMSLIESQKMTPTKDSGSRKTLRDQKKGRLVPTAVTSRDRLITDKEKDKDKKIPAKEKKMSLNDILHPFITEVEAKQGMLFCPGNFSLASLNLAYNKIGVTGVESLSETLTYQASKLRTISTFIGTGLLRLVLKSFQAMK